MITEKVNDFIADFDEDSEVEELRLPYSNGYKPMLDRLITNIVEVPSRGKNFEGTFDVENARACIPRVNGKHNKHVQHVSLKAEGELLSQGNGIARIIRANIPMYKEILPGLESWQTSKITSWHNIEGHSVLWLSVVCLDRKGKYFIINFSKNFSCFVFKVDN